MTSEIEALKSKYIRLRAEAEQKENAFEQARLGFLAASEKATKAQVPLMDAFLAWVGGTAEPNRY
jgi:hypothetical protein